MMVCKRPRRLYPPEVTTDISRDRRWPVLQRHCGLGSAGHPQQTRSPLSRRDETVPRICRGRLGAAAMAQRITLTQSVPGGAYQAGSLSRLRLQRDAESNVASFAHCVQRPSSRHVMAREVQAGSVSGRHKMGGSVSDRVVRVGRQLLRRTIRSVRLDPTVPAVSTTESSRRSGTQTLSRTGRSALGTI